ncbi:MAG: Stk1 family PASTA domain-containing Ser/Thr kinase [Actinomycetota bacterium]|nr:Stk1 family PASTA domain-containing Ser/Thr kinase [Actinomycetota bacterium]
MTAEAKTYGQRYEVIERVGVGGMAEVYRARDGLLGREVAVKVLSDRLSTDQSFVERFRREAQAAANLSHPNIVSLYDYGSDDGANFIVMELIDGRGLEAVIAQEGPLLPERAAEIASDVARALERAHNTGLVHRDVKPSNIMITSYGQTKVTDFGIARALGDGDQTMTQTGMVIGTASYLAPEQAQGNPVDVRSDVYALGCVLFEMLTGRAPFTGDTPLSIAYKHVRETPQKPSDLNPDVPDALDAIALKALAKNPDNRYQTAREMREDLQRFIEGQPVLATPLLAAATTVAPAATGTQVISRTEDEWVDEREPDKKRAGIYVAAALLILGVFALLAYLLANNLLGDDEDAVAQIRVPDVVNEKEETARGILEDKGLEVDVRLRPSNKPKGIVVEQDPEAGERLEEGGLVTLFVSEGPRQTEVPDVIGLSQEEAEAELADAKLTVGEISVESSDTVEAGSVISQSPEPGEEVDVRSEVDLVISGGPEAVVVPSVIGQSEDTAVAEIEAAGLVADVLTAPSEDPEGVVFAQDPEAGAEAQPGDVVTITVSEGAREREMPDVTGQDADDAEAFLEAEFGLVVSQVQQACANATPPGAVCDQDPAPGTPVAEGDEATLFVQAGDATLPGVFASLLALLFFV